MHLLRCDPFAGFIVLVGESSLDVKAGGVLGSADIVHDGFITLQWLASPVHADGGKELMFDGVPLGSAWWVVADGNGQLKGIAELMLQMIFPGPRTSTVGAAAIGKDQQLIGL